MIGMLFLAWAVAALGMALLWIRQRRRNAAVVDVAWSFATGAFGVAFALMFGTGPIRFVVAGIAAAWALRLGLHLADRIAHDTREDVRYRVLREEWGSRYGAYLFGFYQIQALWAVLFALPMLGAALDPSPLSLRVAAGAGLFLVSWLGEASADRQLERFRRTASPGEVCREGWWKYSRHPNYFFEWIHWFAYPVLGWNGAAGPWLWLGPLVMLFFLRRVTGIPLLEKHLVQSRGDAYREYQRTVNAFFPGPPRRSS